MNKILWTDEEINILEKLIKNNKTIKDCHAVFKYRSMDSIRNKISSLGYTAPSGVRDIDFEAFNKLIKGK